MNNYRIAFPLVLLILFLALISLNVYKNYSPPGTSRPVFSDYAKYRLVYHITARNTGEGGTLRGRLYLPLPRSNAPFQRVENLTIEPSPRKIYTDREGNKIGVFPLTANPFQGKTIAVSFDVTVYHVSFPLQCGESANLPPFVSRYLAADEVFRTDLPEIQNISERIKANEPFDYYRLVNLYDYVRKNFTFRESSLPRTVQEVVRDRVVQCGDANTLFVSLCRASGIPAVFVGGVYVSRDQEVFAQTHSWIRAYIRGLGWIPVDPTLGRFDNRTRYLCFGEQRRFYITLWEGFSEPALFRPDSPEGQKPQLLLRMELQPSFWEKKSQAAAISPLTIPRVDSPVSAIREKYDAAAFRHYSSGLKLWQAGNFDGAIQEFEKAIEISPGFVRAHRDFIRCSFFDGRGERLFIHYKRLHELFPCDTLHKYYYALCLINEGRYSQAEQALRECEKEGFTSCELYNSLGYMYLFTKQFDNAEITFKRALGTEGEHFAVYANLMAMLQNAEEWEKMYQWACLGLEEFSDNQYLLGQAGFALIELKRPAEAKRYLLRAIQKDPAMGWYYALLGWAQRDLGENEQAKQNLRKGLQLRKGIGYLKYYEDMLKELDK